MVENGIEWKAASIIQGIRSCASRFYRKDPKLKKKKGYLVSKLDLYLGP